jgi:hypothetical protein
MAQGLLGNFQPQGVGYGNILMDEPVQYGLDDGFGALAEVMQMYGENAMRGVSAPYRAYTGELGDPMEEAMNVAGLITGGGLLTGAPERMAAAEAGQSMLGAGGGYYGGLLDEVPRAKIERMLEVARGQYVDPVRVTDKKKFTDLGGSKPSDKPYTSMTSQQTDVGGLAPIVDVDIQDMIGKELIFTPADRTSINKLVESVDNVPLSEALLTEGGLYYPRQTSNWASDIRPMNSAKKRQNQVLEGGNEPVFSTMMMGARSDGFSSQTSQIAKRMIDNSKIDEKDIKAFDDRVRKKYPEWAGIKDEKAEEQLISDGGLRMIFTDLLRNKEFTKAGFPDMSSVRKASTQEEFLGLPDGLIGQSLLYAPTPITGLRPSGHTTYNVTFDNPDVSYMGRLGYGKIPFEIAAPDYLAARRRNNQPVEGDQRSLTMATTFARQPVTPRYADRISQFVDEGQKLGILY